MTPSPNPHPVDALINHPDFASLSDEEKRLLINKVQGGSSQEQNKLNVQDLATKMWIENMGVKMHPGEADPSEAIKGLNDPAINILRPILSSLGAGAATSASAPVLGPGAPLAGAAAYTGIDALLQHLMSNPPSSITGQVLGLKPGGVADTLTSTGEQAAIGKLMSAAGRGIKAFANVDQPEITKLFPTTSQLAKSEGQPILASAAKALEDTNLFNVKGKVIDRSAGAGFTQALRTAKDSGFIFNRDPNVMLDLLGENTSKSFKLQDMLGSFDKVDKVVQDPKKLQDVLTTAQTQGVGDNLRKTLQGYQFMRMFNNAADRAAEASGYTSNVVKLSPQSLAKDWLDPEMQESYKLLYNSQQRGNISQFFKNVALTQDKISGQTMPMRFVKGGVVLGMGMLTGSLTGSYAGGLAGSAGIYMSAKTLGALLTNPKVARVVVAMAGNEPLGMSQQFAGKLIGRALQGEVLGLMDSKGNEKPITIQDGQIVPLGK